MSSPQYRQRTGSIFIPRPRKGSIFPRPRSESIYPRPRSESIITTEAKFKVVLLGDQGVGKTSIFFRVKSDQFIDMRHPTLGQDICSTKVAVGGTQAELFLCDTAGSERYRTLTRNYYRHTKACLLVFAVNDPTSLYRLSHWEQDARNFAPDALRFLVGNKSDLRGASISASTMKSFAASHDCDGVFTTSAKTGDGIATILSDVTEQLIEQYRHATSMNDLMEESWLKETVNVYKGEEIPGFKPKPSGSCC